MFLAIETIAGVVHFVAGILMPGLYLNFFSRRKNEPSLRHRVSAWMLLSWAVFLIATILNIAVTIPIKDSGGLLTLTIVIAALGVPGVILIFLALCTWKAGNAPRPNLSNGG